MGYTVIMPATTQGWSYVCLFNDCQMAIKPVMGELDTVVEDDRFLFDKYLTGDGSDYVAVTRPDDPNTENRDAYHRAKLMVREYKISHL